MGSVGTLWCCQGAPAACVVSEGQPAKQIYNTVIKTHCIFLIITMYIVYITGSIHYIHGIIYIEINNYMVCFPTGL